MASVTIPLVPLSAVSLADTGLGSCSVSVDSKDAGFVVHGSPGSPEDARFKALLVSETELWLEVWDDAFVSGAGSWLFDDHFELWTAALDTDASYGFCYEVTGKMEQWAVRISDAKVFAGHGSPAPIPARRFDGGDSVRLQVMLPAPVAQLTVVYSDSDDRKTQERLIATSTLKYGDPLSVGGVKVIDPSYARCVVSGGQLRPQDTQDPKRFEPTKALF